MKEAADFCGAEKKVVHDFNSNLKLTVDLLKLFCEISYDEIAASSEGKTLQLAEFNLYRFDLSRYHFGDHGTLRSKILSCIQLCRYFVTSIKCD